MAGGPPPSRRCGNILKIVIEMTVEEFVTLLTLLVEWLQQRFR
jgi:hypothetical protein